MPILVAFDYRCGYSYKAARYLRELSRLGEEVDIEWVPFSLEQVNFEHGDDVYLWDHPEIETGSFLGLAAGRWIRKTSPEAFDAYHSAAFGAMHDDGKQLDRDTILALAKDAGADLDALESGLDSGDAIRLAGADYARMCNEHGVFGTPTFIFPANGALYVRLRGVWEDDAHRLKVWEHIRELAGDEIVGEIKRVVPPEVEACPMPVSPRP